MASKADRKRARNAQANAKPNGFEAPFLAIAGVIRRGRLWTPSDANTVVDALATMHQGMTGTPIPEITAAMLEWMHVRIAGAIVDLFPDLLRQFLSCNSKGQSPTAVSIESFIDCVALVAKIIASSALDHNFEDLVYNSPIFQKVLQIIAVPAMTFMYELVTGCDAVSCHFRLRQAAIHLTSNVLSGDAPPTHIIHACPNAALTVTSLLEAIEYDELDEFSTVLPSACLLINQGYCDHKGAKCFPPDLECMVMKLLRAATRVGFLPSDDNLAVGEQMIDALESWALLHWNANFRATDFEADHFVAWPLILTWCTNQATFDEIANCCCQVLVWYCNGFCDVGHADAVMPAEDAAGLLKFIIKERKDKDWSDKEVYEDLHEVVKALLFTGIPKNAEFVEALNCRTVFKMIKPSIPVPAPMGFDEGVRFPWGTKALRLNQSLLQRFLAQGLPAAQSLLEYAIAAESEYEFDDDYDEMRHDVGLIHFALTETALFEGVSYASLVAHHVAIIKSLRQDEVLDDISNDPAAVGRMLRILSFLSGHDNECDIAVRAVIYEVFEHSVFGDWPVSRDHDLAFPWTPEGWRLRSQLIDIYLDIMCFATVTEGEHERQVRLKDLVATWLSQLITLTDGRSHPDAVELQARAIYCVLLDDSLSLAGFKMAAGKVYLHFPRTMAAQKAYVLLQYGVNAASLAEELCCLSLWVYCSLYLAVDQATVSRRLPMDTLRDWRNCCEALLDRRRCHDDARTREAAAAVVRLLTEGEYISDYM